MRAHPASREPRTFTEKQYSSVVDPQEEKELPQMILRPLFRNIPRRPSHLIDENMEVKRQIRKNLTHIIRGGIFMNSKYIINLTFIPIVSIILLTVILYLVEGSDLNWLLIIGIGMGFFIGRFFFLRKAYSTRK